MVERNRAYLREWLPWVDFTASPEDLRRFIVKVREQFASGRGPQCGIWIDGAFAGSMGCHPDRLAQPELQHRLLDRGALSGQGHHDALLREHAGLPVRRSGPAPGDHSVRRREHAQLRHSRAAGLHARRRHARRRVGQRSLAGSGVLGNAGAGLAGARAKPAALVSISAFASRPVRDRARRWSRRRVSRREDGYRRTPSRRGGAALPCGWPCRVPPGIRSA